MLVYVKKSFNDGPIYKGRHYWTTSLVHSYPVNLRMVDFSYSAVIPLGSNHLRSELKLC